MLEPSKVGLTAHGKGKEIVSSGFPLDATIELDNGRLLFFHRSFVRALSMHKLEDFASDPVNGIFFLVNSDCIKPSSPPRP